MLRVGQMALAEGLRRSEGMEKYGDPDSVDRLIDQFVQSKQKFSVENMVRVGS